MIVATAAYFDCAAIQASGLAPLASTVGSPKFALGYPFAGSAGPVAPLGIFGRGLEAEEFRRRYRARLDEFGVDRASCLCRRRSRT